MPTPDLSAVATASRLPTANRGSNNSYTTSWDTTLHYVLDLWFQKKWRTHEVKGDTVIVRYADDFVVGFQHKQDAERFLKHLKERLGCFELDLHPDKTRLIEFGRFARKNRQHRGLGKPETFDLSGFHAPTARRTGKGGSNWGANRSRSG